MPLGIPKIPYPFKLNLSKETNRYNKKDEDQDKKKRYQKVRLPWELGNIDDEDEYEDEDEDEDEDKDEDQDEDKDEDQDKKKQDTVIWRELPDVLYRERIVFLSGHFTAKKANIPMGMMLSYESYDCNKHRKDICKEVYLFINSTGGNVRGGLGIVDTMQRIRAQVHTINLALACSISALILAAGECGKRLGLPTSLVLMYQPFKSFFRPGAYKKLLRTKKAQLKGRQALQSYYTVVRAYTKNTRRNPVEIADAMEDPSTLLRPPQAETHGIIDSLAMSRAAAYLCLLANVLERYDKE